MREGAAALGWRQDSYVIDARGPCGEELSIDAATSPSWGSARTVVVSSGLHGVEGFFGSAVQLALLERWRAAPPPCRVVLLHALNPYGFAWIRRTDERNVDLNRNFLRNGERYAGAPRAYSTVDATLNPRRAPCRRLPLLAALAPAILRHGMRAITQAVTKGQYVNPRGLFYGGAAPSLSRSVIEAVILQATVGAQEVVHLDLHTGLGRYAEGKLLVDYVPEATGLSYVARGGFGAWCVARGLAPSYRFAYGEFGTFSGLRVLAGLRAENDAHHWWPPSDSRTIRAKHRLKELFCPSHSDWRLRGLATAIGFVEDAMRG